MTSISLY